MRRRWVSVVAVLGIAAGAGCASPSPSPPAVPSPRPVVDFPAVAEPRPPTAIFADPTRPPPGPPLPAPIAIPDDPYAPEPVVELGTIEIPAIGLRQRLYQGVTLHNIDKGPSHWTGSALPGQMGNIVVAGHRATFGQPFRRIDALVPGDAVIFTVGGARWTYRVTGHLIVTPADSWIADQTAAVTGTLYACHPVGSADERYVVRLELAS